MKRNEQTVRSPRVAQGTHPRRNYEETKRNETREQQQQRDTRTRSIERTTMSKLLTRSIEHVSNIKEKQNKKLEKTKKEENEWTKMHSQGCIKLLQQGLKS